MPTLDQKPHVTYLDDQSITEKLSPSNTKKMQRGWEITQQIVKLNAELKTVKQHFEDTYGAGAKLILPDEKCSLTISESTTISIADFDQLEELMGDHVDAYATTKTTHSPTKQYKDIIVDEDHELHDEFAETASIKQSTSCKYLAIR